MGQDLLPRRRTAFDARVTSVPIVMMLRQGTGRNRIRRTRTASTAAISAPSELTAAA